MLVTGGSRKLLTARDAAQCLDVDVARASLSNTLSVLARIGVVARLGKGLYLNASTGTTPRIIDVISDVFQGNPHFLGLNAAANFWGLTVQIPHSYHVLYSPNNEAERKRILRWCKALAKRTDMGGELIPIKTRTPSKLVGTSQVIMEGTQMPVSTRERTVIDAVIYTEEVGGAGEAVTWVRNAFTSQARFNIGEFRYLLEIIQREFHSAMPRMGFVLEHVLEEQVSNSRWSRELKRILDEFQNNIVQWNASYSWGPRTKPRLDKPSPEESSEYFKRWRLHVSQKYLRQIQV